MAHLEGEYSFDKNGIRMDYTTPTPRYSVLNDETLDQGIAYLGQHGYAVLSDVMSPDEIRFNKDLLWSFLETIPGKRIRRDDPQTWSSYWPGLASSGVVNNCGIGQSDFMWSVRANRQIKRIYSRAWNTNQLLVSFDGCGIYRDWRYERQWRTNAAWYHVDQNPVIKPERCCIQGFLSLTDQNATTGGLIVFPGTHLRFAELSDLARRPKDFIMIPKAHPILDNGRAIAKLVQCQAGDFVLWDSRLVHCNAPAFVTEDRSPDGPIDLLRIVAYVSMSPASFVQGQTIDQFRKKRKQAVQDNCTLSHWSTEIVEAKPHGDLPKVNLSKLDAYQRALVIGADPEEE